MHLWIFDCFEIFFQLMKGRHFGKKKISSGSSAFFRPHFCNSHEYHPYSSNWYPNFLWYFISKSRVKVRLAIFSKSNHFFLHFYNLPIKLNVLNLTFFRQKMNPRKIAILLNWKKNLKEVENPATRHIRSNKFIIA